MTQDDLLRTIDQAKREGWTELDLSDKQLKVLPPEIGQLTQLQMLSVRRNQLTALPAEIGQLTQLQRLSVWHNQLTALPAEIGQLTQLQTLDVDGNRLTALPTEIGQLTQLQTLYVIDNQLAALPAEIGQLTQLQGLYVHYNHLTALPVEIGQLTNLQTLDVSWNKISALPVEIGQLLHLQWLEVSCNVITELPVEIGQLTQLQRLEVGNNQLTALPSGLWGLPSILGIDVRDNFLQVPPEILGMSERLERFLVPPAQPLLREYANIMRSGTPLNEARVIVIGEARAGKTSVVRRLLGEPFDPNEDSTHGIFIRQWGVPSGLGNISVNLWDFGGQDIYKATHQFFFSQRAVYVLVLNGEQNETQNRIEYWLSLVASYGAGARVVVVINERDGRMLNPDENRYRLSHPYIAGAFVRMNAASNHNLAALQQVLENEVRSLRHVHTRLYDRHIAIKQKLASKNKSYISREQFAEYCDDAGVTGDEPQAWLLRLLNDLGSAISFDDPHITGKFVLNPEWVTRGVYAALENTPSPRVRLSDIRQVLNAQDYPGDAPLWILNLMRKFELCYPLDETADPQYLLLDRLPNSTPSAVQDWETDPDSLRFEYEYAALPGSVITRVVVRLHERAHPEHVPWRSGAFLRSADGHNEALVFGDEAKNRTHIVVRGNPTTRRDFFAAIRAQFEHVHESVNLKPTAFVRVPPELLNDNERSKPTSPIRYDHLLAAERAGKREWFVPELGRDIPLRPLLDGVRALPTKQAICAVLTKIFSLDEQRLLCADLKENFEAIYGGDGGTGISALKIVEYFSNRDKLESLVGAIRRKRPGAI